jgi:ABC-type branched-subunit amino acid transport system substrate-binding protein
LHPPNVISKMKKLLLALAILFFAGTTTNAQDVKPNSKIYHVAIFSPLYLDSAFNGETYKYGKTFPKFTQPGLDFAQGAQIALDSLPLPKGSIQANIYDTKAYDENVAWLLQNKKLDSVDLIIGSVKDADLTQLSAFAKQKNIPFISATSPNDGGVVANPFMVLAQASLRAHCEAIYSYLLQNHGNSKIFLCRKKGSQEDKIAEYFKNLNEGEEKPMLDIQTLNFVDDDYTQLNSRLDSNTKSIIIGASLNNDFATGLTKACYDMYVSYPIEIIGMPNWESFADLRKPTYKDFPILFTASYHNSKTDILSRKIQSVYTRKFKVSPTEMAYKGFETVYFFAKLLTKYPDDFMSHLNESNTKVFTEFNFKPVYLTKKNTIPDYFENKHLYFLQLQNGKISNAW